MKFYTALFVMCVLFTSCDAEEPIGNEPQYFGFAVVDCGHDDPHDTEVKTNYLNEVSGFSNVAQLCSHSPDENITERVAYANELGIKPILHVEGIFFQRLTGSSSPSSTERLTLRADASNRWNQFLGVNNSVLDANTVAAIYLVDEPAWNGLSLIDYENALAMIKSSLPSIPTMAIEAGNALDRLMVPADLDWIGFDNYDSVDPANDSVWLDQLARVSKARVRQEQKLVIVASTQWLPYYKTDAGIDPIDMGPIMQSYYQLAISHADVIALIGYLWPGGLDDPAQLGARDLPSETKAIIVELGKQIITQNN